MSGAGWPSNNNLRHEAAGHDARSLVISGCSPGIGSLHGA